MDLQNQSLENSKRTKDRLSLNLTALKSNKSKPSISISSPKNNRNESQKLKKVHFPTLSDSSLLEQEYDLRSHRSIFKPPPPDILKQSQTKLEMPSGVKNVDLDVDEISEDSSPTSPRGHSREQIMDSGSSPQVHHSEDIAEEFSQYDDGIWKVQLSTCRENINERLKVQISRKMGNRSEKEQYMDNYSVVMQIPAMYILDAKFYPGKTKHLYMIRIVKYVLPTFTSDNEYKFKMHSFDPSTKQVVESNPLSAYELHSRKNYTQISLELHKYSNGYLTMVRQTFLEGSKNFAMFEFSQDGQYMAIFINDNQQGKLNLYQIYDNKIEDIFIEQKRQRKHSYLQEYVMTKHQNQVSELDTSDILSKFPKKIKFAPRGDYIAIYGDKQAAILDVSNIRNKQDLQESKQVYDIPDDEDRFLVDLQIISEKCEITGNPYKCKIAEFCKDHQKIAIKNFYDESNLDFNFKDSKCLTIAINFATYEQLDKYQEFFVRISEDFSRVIFCFGVLNYMSFINEQGFLQQEELLYLKKKDVRNIQTVGEDFYIICCKAYDKDLDIYCTRWVNKYGHFKLSVDRRIEPNCMRVFDCIIKEPNKKLRDKDTMFILSARDQLVFFDTVQYSYDKIMEWVEDPSQEKPKTQAVIESMDGFASSFSQQWPYICFRDIKMGWLWLIDLNDQNEVQIIVLPEKVIEIQFTFITKSYELYIVCMALIGNKELGYKVFKCSLRNSKNVQRFVFENILEFTRQDIENLFINSKSKMIRNEVNFNSFRIFDMWVRPSNKAYDASGNQKEMIFIIIDEIFICQISGCKPQLVMFTKSKSMYLIGENKIAIQELAENPDVFRLVNIEISFSSYRKAVAYEEFNHIEVMKSLAYDVQEGIIMLMYMVQSEHDKKRFMKIIDINSGQILFNNQITNKDLIGRLKCGIFTLVNGHLYYDNRVIKIRYDLIRRDNIYKHNQQDTFDFYYNLLDLENEQKEEIQMFFPKISLDSHKMVYLTQSSQIQEIVQHFQEDEHDHQNDFHNESAFLDKGLKHLEDHWHIEYLSSKLIVMPFLHDRKIYFNRSLKKMEYFQFSMSHTDHKEYMVIMNITMRKFSIYDKKGLKIKSFEIEEQVQKYGEPFTVSENGTNFVFLKMTRHNDKMINEIQMTLMKFEFETGLVSKHSKINIRQEFSKIQLKGINSEDIKIKTFDCEINDKCQVIMKFEIEYPQGCQQVFAKLAPDIKIQLELVKNYKIFNKSQEDEQSEQKITGFEINSQYIFLYNDNQIFFDEIEKDGEPKQKVNLLLDPKMIKIVNIEFGCISRKIAISLKYINNEGEKFFLTWDLIKNQEINSLEVSDQSKTLFDKVGEIYLVDHDKVYLLKDKVCLTCFQTDYKMGNDQAINPKFDLNKGHCFDGKQNMWLLTPHFILIPFSYMTFVLRQEVQWDDECYYFDLEQYNFLLNKRNCFTISTELAVQNDYLEYILQNFERIDHSLFDLLQHHDIKEMGKHHHHGGIDIIKHAFHNHARQTKIVSPLHIAYAKKQGISINLILEYMTKIKRKNLEIFMDIVDELLEYERFLDYYLSSQFQTKNLEVKTTLRVNHTVTDEIVAFQMSNTSYIDNEFFQKEMKDIQSQQQQTENSTNYLVEIKSIEIGWIIETDGGILFLNAILSSDSKDIFNNDAIQKVIEFYFQLFKLRIMMIRFPMYMGQVFVIHATISQNPKLEDGYMHYSGIKMDFSINIINILCVTASAFMLGCQLYFSKSKSFLWNKWNYFEIVYIVCSVMLSVQQIRYLYGCHEDIPDSGKIKFNEYMKDFQHLTPCQDIEHLNRWLQSIIVLIIYFKALFFLQLNDKVSPLIGIIFKIMYEIRFFILIVLFTLFGFTNSYYMFGRNQLQFDRIPIGQHPQYSTIIGSIQYGFYLFGFTEVGVSNFQRSSDETNSQEQYLWIIFVIATFVLCLHLLNMLIALMGEIQNTQAEDSNFHRYQFKLNIIIGHLWLFPNKQIEYLLQQKKYLVVATKVNEEAQQHDFYKIVDQIREREKQRMQIAQQALEEVRKIKFKLGMS